MPVELPAQLLALARDAKGFMPDDEGLALHLAARQAARTRLGALLEVGAYCGKSTIWLGAAAREESTVCWSVDHHRGSEELQAGWAHHDPSLVDRRSGRMDSLPTWRRTIEEAGLEAWVIGVVGDSPTVAAHWGAPLALVFVDGGHGPGPAWADFRGWAPHVALGGLLAIHDVFADPADGGRPPYEIWRAALESGCFKEVEACGSLRVLRRIRPDPCAE
jgi:predicted O-methyltransferase YrrM